MFVYRDLEGAALRRVLKKHLYFDKKECPQSRIRYEACLPSYYGVGCRFIRLQRAPPLGFKCSPMPISLRAARAISDNLAKLAKIEANLEKQNGSSTPQKEKSKIQNNRKK
ncbi:uncharacterized protein LOC131994828 [Stomoxys calcitrans]|uniref:uncharacterized protein LOC131994828 n=1 Tax=Stomoxys calcitrans TaxID=35570 RepID=UPI0027E39746|nr:uncharacterized protein LOC131994828 [Stomoxys calcitrans]